MEKRSFFSTTPMFQDFGLLAMRLAFGGSMLFAHGLGKFNKLLEGGEIKFADPFGIGEEATLAMAVFAELLCSALLILGLFTRAALVPLLFTMAMAFFVIHADDPFGQKEKAMIFGVGYLYLLLSGPGRYSLDHYLFKNRSQPVQN